MRDDGPQRMQSALDAWRRFAPSHVADAYPFAPLLGAPVLHAARQCAQVLLEVEGLSASALLGVFRAARRGDVLPVIAVPSSSLSTERERPQRVVDAIASLADAAHFAGGVLLLARAPIVDPTVLPHVLARHVAAGFSAFGVSAKQLALAPEETIDAYRQVADAGLALEIEWDDVDGEDEATRRCAWEAIERLRRLATVALCGFRSETTPPPNSAWLWVTAEAHEAPQRLLLSDRLALVAQRAATRSDAHQQERVELAVFEAFEHYAAATNAAGGASVLLEAMLRQDEPEHEHGG